MTARRTPSAWWLLAAPTACVAILGLSEPVLFVWLLVGLVIGWALVASWKWFLWQERAVAAESDLIFAPTPVEVVEVVGSKGTRLQAAEDARDAEERLTDPATATTVPVPLLRAGKGLLTVVPPVADGDDYWARLMKATEERS